MAWLRGSASPNPQDHSARPKPSLAGSGPSQTLQWMGLGRQASAWGGACRDPRASEGHLGPSEASGEKPRRQLWVRRAGEACRGGAARKALNCRAPWPAAGKVRKGRPLAWAPGLAGPELRFPQPPSVPAARRRPGVGCGPGSRRPELGRGPGLGGGGEGQGQAASLKVPVWASPMARSAAQRGCREGAQTGSWGWGQGSCIIPKAPLGPSGNPDTLWGFLGLRTGRGFQTPDPQVLGGGGGGTARAQPDTAQAASSPGPVLQGLRGETASGTSRSLKRMAFGGHCPWLT